MQTSIVQIGNSRGIRIPKSLLRASALPERVELIARRGLLTVRPARHARSEWDDAFRTMAHRGDDKSLDREIHRETRWEKSEWNW